MGLPSFWAYNIYNSWDIETTAVPSRLQVDERIVHPSQVPFQVKAQPEICWPVTVLCLKKGGSWKGLFGAFFCGNIYHYQSIYLPIYLCIYIVERERGA